jgi:amidohydrolase
MISKEQFIRSAEELLPALVSIRRHLHTYPELSFKEVKTSSYLSSILEKEGIAHTTGWVETGIVASLGKGEKCVGLRGDMDALPIDEMNEVPYKSKNKGIMHACGHDVHSTCLLGALILLNGLSDELGGRVKGIFQPGEEKLPGGASLMIQEGVMLNPKPDAIFALHVHPPIQVGKIGLKAGRYMASADEIYITIKGKGGHAGLPENVIDPLIISASVLLQLQQIVSRNSSPHIPTVLSFGKINSVGGATNVVPDEVKLEGTFRTFDEDWRHEVHGLIKRIATNIARAAGGEAEVNIIKGYPVLDNNPELTENAIAWSQELLGESQVIDLPRRMSAEDFAFYTHDTPGCFIRLGVSNSAKGINSPVHTSTFDIDEAALVTGTATLAWVAYKFLQS